MNRRLELIWRTPERSPYFLVTIAKDRVTVKVPHDTSNRDARNFLSWAHMVSSNCPTDVPTLRGTVNDFGRVKLRSQSGTVYGTFIYDNTEDYTW